RSYRPVTQKPPRSRSASPPLCAHSVARTMPPEPRFAHPRHRGSPAAGSGGTRTAGPFEGGDERMAPGEHVLVPHAVDHAFPPTYALLSRHVDRSLDRIADLVLAIGIHQQRVLQLQRCARKAREDQDAGIIRIL